MEPGEFHAHDGWTFSRRNDGSVIIAQHVDGDPSMPATGLIVLEPSSWASIVAHVSAHGEKGETYQQALEFHEAR